MNKRPEKETNPQHYPGQIVNPIPDSKLYKPVHGGYPVDTEEMFTPYKGCNCRRCQKQRLDKNK